MGNSFKNGKPFLRGEEGPFVLQRLFEAEFSASIFHKLLVLLRKPKYSIKPRKTHIFFRFYLLQIPLYNPLYGVILSIINRDSLVPHWHIRLSTRVVNNRGYFYGRSNRMPVTLKPNRIRLGTVMLMGKHILTCPNHFSPGGI